jgi:hydrogenase/urease accessory protein HupE
VRRTLLVGLALALALLAGAVAAHPIRSGYLEVARLAPEEYRVRWTMPLIEPGLPELDPVFDRRCAPLAAPVDVVAVGRLARSWTMRCAGGLGGTRLAVPGLAAAHADLLLRVVDGATTTMARLTPSTPAFNFATERAMGGVIGTYLVLGIEHILLGADHLLFVLGLLLLVRDRWTLVKTITAFTLAHSITLAAATLGYVHVPGPPLNAAIALSILFLGVEVVRASRGEVGFGVRRPWALAFAFGLLHGLGFATGLADLGLSRGELPLALFLFNVGVEAGQLLFVALVLLLERAFRLLEIAWPRPMPLLPAYLVGSLGAFWSIDRITAMLGGTG